MSDAGTVEITQMTGENFHTQYSDGRNSSIGLNNYNLSSNKAEENAMMIGF